MSSHLVAWGKANSSCPRTPQKSKQDSCGESILECIPPRPFNKQTKSPSWALLMAPGFKSGSWASSLIGLTFQLIYSIMEKGRDFSVLYENGNPHCQRYLAKLVKVGCFSCPSRVQVDPMTCLCLCSCYLYTNTCDSLTRNLVAKGFQLERGGLHSLVICASHIMISGSQFKKE